MNQKNYIRLGLLSLLIVTLTLPSCLKEYSNPNKISKTTDYHPSMAVAVGKGKLTVRDIITDYDLDELFQEASDGSLFLNYSKKATCQDAETLIKLSDQKFPKVPICNKTIYDVVPVVDGFKTFPTVTVLNSFLVGNEEDLDLVILDTLDFFFTVNSTFELAGNLSIAFPSLKMNGQPIVVDVPLDNSGSFQYVYQQRLVNCELAFGEDNNIIAEFSLTMEDGTANVTDTLDITMEMNNLNFKAIYGYIGHVNTPIDRDTIEIESFNTAFSGDLWLKEPSITMVVENDFGVPVRNYFGNLHTYSVRNNPTGAWTNYEFPYDFIDFPSPNEIGGTAQTTVELNNNNFPLLGSLVSNYPNKLVFEVDSVVINQGGYDPNLPNFVIDTSKVSVEMNVKIPLKGNAWYSLVDTFDMEIEREFGKISEQFSEINIRTIFNNALPTNVYAQVVFLDSLLMPIDTLFEGGQEGNRLIQSPILDATGKVVEPVETVTDILFGDSPNYHHNINMLKKVRKAIVIATLKTNENGAVGKDAPSVNFYGNNFLEIKFGVRATAKY